jgi:tetratricopeptide (TPR) repeat protein
MLALTLAAVLGLAAVATAQDDAAEKTLRDRVEAAEGKDKAQANAELAKLLESRSRWSEAASAWRQARRLRGDVSDLEGEARALLAFAEDVIAQGETGTAAAAAFEDAHAALSRARAAGSKSVDVALGLARCAEYGNDTATRLAELKTATAAAPDDIRATRAFAAALAAAGDPAESSRLCGELSDAHPKDAEIALSYYEAAKRAGDETKERAAGVRAVSAAPTDIRGWTAVWHIYSPKQRWGELADACVELATANPDGPWSARYAGVSCSTARRFDEALVWLEKAWTRNAKDTVARSEAGKILYYQKNDRPGAMRLFSEALATDPASPDAYTGLYNMAVRYDAEGDKAAASKVFELLTNARPEDPVARNNYANSLRFAGRYDDSEKEYLAAIAKFPQDAQVRNDYALLLDVEGRNEDAVKVLAAAHEVDPTNNDSMENLGFLARARGDTADALKWFRMAHANLVAKGENDHKHRINVDDQRWPLPPLP